MNEEHHDHPKTTEETHTETNSRKTMDKIWGATVDTWHQATFTAGKYSRVVQKKIDLTSVHKKISTAHTDLGKIIDDLHQAGAKRIMAQTEVQEMLDTLTELRTTAATMEEEIATIRSEEPAEEELHKSDGGNA